MIRRKPDRLPGVLTHAGALNHADPLNHDCHDWQSAKDHCQSSFRGSADLANEVLAAAADSAVRGYYRTLLRGLDWPSNRSADSLQTLAITSCQRGEGVSTVAAHLAVTAASSLTHRVLLVDANIAWPSLHKTFGLTLDPGQSDHARPRRSVQSTHYKNLGLLTSRSLSGNDPTSIDGLTERFSQLVVAAKRSFDLAVFDMPAANPTNLGLQLFAIFDGVLLVAEAERVRSEVAEHTKQKLDQVGANLLGVVLNKRTYHIPNWLYRTL